MEDEERPVRRGPESLLGAASLLAGESLDSYSQDELAARVALLEAELARVKAQLDKADAHRLAAEAFFRPRSETTGS